jgi:hypothetical protein
MTDPIDDPWSAQFPQAEVGDWVYYNTASYARKLLGLVIEVDQKTNFMRVHCFNTMAERWFTRKNSGQYKVL